MYIYTLKGFILSYERHFMKDYLDLQKQIFPATHLKFIKDNKHHKEKFTPYHKIVYIWLYDEFRLKNTMSYKKSLIVTHRMVADRCGMSERTIKKIIPEFESWGLVRLTERVMNENGYYNPTEYLGVINPVCSPSHKLHSDTMTAFYSQYKNEDKRSSKEWRIHRQNVTNELESGVYLDEGLCKFEKVHL